MKIATAAQFLIKGGKVVAIEPTGSMRPMLDEHCLVVMSDEPYENIEVRDMIVYKSNNGRLIVHRVMEKKRNGRLWTRGDHNKVPDNEYVTQRNYVGKVFVVVYFRE